MRLTSLATLAILLAAPGSVALAQTAPAAAAPQPAGPPNGTGSYADFETLFARFNAWKTPKAVNGIVDYSLRPSPGAAPNWLRSRPSCPALRSPAGIGISRSIILPFARRWTLPISR